MAYTDTTPFEGSDAYKKLLYDLKTKPTNPEQVQSLLGEIQKLSTITPPKHEFVYGAGTHLSCISTSCFWHLVDKLYMKAVPSSSYDYMYKCSENTDQIILSIDGYLTLPIETFELSRCISQSYFLQSLFRTLDLYDYPVPKKLIKFVQNDPSSFSESALLASKYMSKTFIKRNGFASKNKLKYTADLKTALAINPNFDTFDFLSLSIQTIHKLQTDNPILYYYALKSLYDYLGGPVHTPSKVVESILPSFTGTVTELKSTLALLK